MAEKANDNTISLKSTKKPVSSYVYTLKLPNFFKVSKKDDGTPLEISSPSFDFARGNWCFRFSSRKSIKGSNGSFTAYLVRLGYRTLRQKVYYTVTLLDANNETYKELHHDHVFDEKEQKIMMAIFKNDKPFYDKRENLTLIVHLVCEKPPEEGVEQTVKKFWKR